MKTTELTPLGDRAVRFARPRSSARAIVRAARAWPGVVDVVVTDQHVAVYFDRPPTTPDVSALDGLPDDPAEAREVVLHAIYDGPDLGEVARALSLTEEDVIAIHARATYTVDVMGFAPGFAYMTGLDPRLSVPRKRTPRARVRAGSLAIAEAFTGVYPFDSPGGWWLLGRVRERMYDGAPRLHLGDRVRFAREDP